MWVEQDFVIRLSSLLRETTTDSKQTVDWLLSFDGQKLMLPPDFQPDEQLLAIHASRRKA